MKGEKATKRDCAGVASDIEGTQEKCVICEAKLKKKKMHEGRKSSPLSSALKDQIRGELRIDHCIIYEW